MTQKHPLRIVNYAFVRTSLANFCCVISRKNFQRDSVLVYFSTLCSFQQKRYFHEIFFTKIPSNQIFERISKKLHKKSVKSFYINRLHRPSWKFRNIFSQFSLENSVKSTFLLLNRCFHEIFMSGESKFLIFRFGFTKKKLLRFSLK